ncbi:hypothetical protein B9Z55_012105 [Caenorhabditis nigoni]|uniref:Uncharacterized protein n=1 Tax=Caenorhabditis nigoni TaxID=1611254 RepID=A0A2G5TVW1_9PELO|nr:hypothetical protein B9Z55_012105 [Caenorhabditis nigoni]
MKEHFSIGILLLFCAYVALCAPSPFNFDNAESKEKLVTLVNQKRSDLAKSEETANMHEMSYDDDLESEIKKARCDLPRGANFIIMTIKTKKDLRFFGYHLQSLSADQMLELEGRVRKVNIIKGTK